MLNSSPAATTTRHTHVLTTLLAYAGFVGLGASNSLVGVAWPSIRDTFGLPLDALGALLIANTLGYMLASALSGRLLARLGVARLLAGCFALATLALALSAAAPSWPALLGLSCVLGLGGGALDGSLNAYAAAHFSPRSMNWLHACFGVGATLGPAIMTWAVVSGPGWRAGYLAVGAIQLALALGFVLSRRSWDAPASAAAQAQGATLAATARLPLVWMGVAFFFVYTGSEIGVGNWVFSLLTEGRGVPAALAGTWVSLYWASLTVGRVVFGFVVQRVHPNTLLRACMAATVVGALLVWLNLASWLTFGGIALLGLALAPQFPMLISATPGYLGQRHAANGVGLQVAAASLGGALLPSLVGVLARARGLEVLGPSLLVGALLMAALFELLVRSAAARSAD